MRGGLPSPWTGRDRVYARRAKTVPGSHTPIIIDRTLVYGATATVVIGVISAVEGFAQDAALGMHESLALQAGVPPLESLCVDAVV